MAGRVELFEGIRRDHRREKLSVRALAERHGVHRRTVRAALASAVPPARKSSPRAAPAIGPWTEVIDGWLVEDKDVPRKQRHTARRIWQRLGAEHGAVLCEVTVSRLRDNPGVRWSRGVHPGGCHIAGQGVPGVLALQSVDEEGS